MRAEQSVSGAETTADSTRLQQSACGTGSNQQWQISDVGGGSYRLVARHSGKCLDVVNGSTADGARVVQYTCNGGGNQQWQRVGLS